MFLWLPLLLNWLPYVLQHFVCAYYFHTQNLKRRYDAQWALVTGASSGIGKALVKGLAKQGLNVVLVALGDNLLDTTYTELQEAYPACQFRKVAANLGQAGYMDAIIKGTSGIKVQIVFCNAGYLLTGFFHSRTMPDLLANLNCNALSAVEITHYFLKALIAENLRGCFVYTSSAAASLPNPFCAQYAATKSFLSSFGASIAPEVKPYGIDVLVVHPSPVDSRFYNTQHKIDMLDFFKKFAVSPDELPDTVFASIGRTVWRDVGPTAICFRVLMKIIDYNFLTVLTATFGRYMPDFKRHFQPVTKSTGR